MELCFHAAVCLYVMHKDKFIFACTYILYCEQSQTCISHIVCVTAINWSSCADQNMFRIRKHNVEGIENLRSAEALNIFWKAGNKDRCHNRKRL